MNLLEQERRNALSRQQNVCDISSDFPSFQRARQILTSLKEQRESLGKSRGTSGTAMATVNVASAGQKVDPIEGTEPILKPTPIKLSTSLTKRLMGTSLQHKKDRVLQLRESDVRNKSPPGSVHSSRTASTHSSTQSPLVSDEQGSGPIVVDVLAEPPTLQDIANAFADISHTERKTSLQSAGTQESQDSTIVDDDCTAANERPAARPRTPPPGDRALPAMMLTPPVMSMFQPGNEESSKPSPRKSTPRGPRRNSSQQQRPAITLQELEMPTHISPLQLRQFLAAATTSTFERARLQTPEGRADYLQGLYSSPRSERPSVASPERSQRHPGSVTPTWQRQLPLLSPPPLLQDAQSISPPSSPESLHEEHANCRQSLWRLQYNIVSLSAKFDHGEQDALLNKDADVTEDTTMIDDEEDNSLACTSHSGTSGWLTDRDDEDNDDNRSLLSLLLIHRRNNDDDANSLASSLLCDDACMDATKQRRPRLPRPLFVDACLADARCDTQGGWYSLATASTELWKSTNDGSVEVVLKEAENSAVLSSSAVVPLRLSQNFRCGAYGSLYDIYTRTAPFLSTDDYYSDQQSLADDIPSHGGLYDLAQRSCHGAKSRRKRKTPSKQHRQRHHHRPMRTAATTATLPSLADSVYDGSNSAGSVCMDGSVHDYSTLSSFAG